MKTMYSDNKDNKKRNVSAINKYSINLLKDKVLKYSKEDNEKYIKDKWFKN